MLSSRQLKFAEKSPRERSATDNCFCFIHQCERHSNNKQSNSEKRSNRCNRTNEFVLFFIPVDLINKTPRYVVFDYIPFSAIQQAYKVIKRFTFYDCTIAFRRMSRKQISNAKIVSYSLLNYCQL